jgi:hypothetical protein
MGAHLNRLPHAHYLVAALTAFLFSHLQGAARTPDSACVTLEVTTNAILGDGRVVRGLHREDFSVRGKHDRIDIESVQYDTAPRRIVLIVDNGPGLNPDARKAQAQILGHILSDARPEDSFAFVSARGPQVEVPFDEPREKVRQVLETTLASGGGGGNGDGFLDAVMRGITLFKGPHQGDAIIAMASEFEKSRSATYHAVAEALTQDHIRMFGFLLGPIMKGAYFTTIGPGAGTVFVPNAQNFSTITWNSGGYMLEEQTEMPWKEYKLSADHSGELETKGWRMYSAIAESYRLQVRLPAGMNARSEWIMELSPTLQKRIPTAEVIYPRSLPVCNGAH